MALLLSGGLFQVLLAAVCAVASAFVPGLVEVYLLVGLAVVLLLHGASPCGGTRASRSGALSCRPSASHPERGGGVAVSMLAAGVVSLVTERGAPGPIVVTAVGLLVTLSTIVVARLAHKRAQAKRQAARRAR